MTIKGLDRSVSKPPQPGFHFLTLLRAKASFWKSRWYLAKILSKKPGIWLSISLSKVLDNLLVKCLFVCIASFQVFVTFYINCVMSAEVFKEWQIWLNHWNHCIKFTENATICLLVFNWYVGYLKCLFCDLISKSDFEFHLH